MTTKYQDDRAAMAVQELVKCVNEGFTGNITFDFKKGTPIVCRKTEIQRWPDKKDPGTLDGGRRPR